MSVDVAIPNFNYGRYLRDCANSVLSQQVEGLRLLIIDNASTDDSCEVAQEIAARDPRVTLVLRSKNMGPHSSFNEAIDWATADYFLILCADDALAPGALERAVTIMDRNPDIAMTYGRDIPIHGQAPLPVVPDIGGDVDWTRITGRQFIKRFCQLGVFQLPGPSLIVRTSSQKQVGYYRPELPHSDDYDVWLRLATTGNVAEIDCVQAFIRTHEVNRSTHSRANQIEHIRETQAAAECFFAHEGAAFPDAERFVALARRGLAGRAYWAAISGFLRGEPFMGSLLAYAVRTEPITALVPPLDYLLARPDALDRIMALSRRLLEHLHRSK